MLAPHTKFLRFGNAARQREIIKAPRGSAQFAVIKVFWRRIVQVSVLPETKHCALEKCGEVQFKGVKLTREFQSKVGRVVS